MLERLKHFATVAILTWLIWWSADRRVTDRDQVVVRLAVKSTDAGRVVSIEDPRPAEVLATVTGPRGRLANFRAQLQRNPGQVFEFAWPVDAPIGPQQVPSRRVLAESREFREAGLDVEDARPSELRVMVDQLETAVLDVKPDFGSLQVANVVCTPAQVEVRRVPAALVRSRFVDRVLRPPAEQALRAWQESQTAGGSEFSIELPLAIAEAATAEFGPSNTVRVTGQFVDTTDVVTRGPVQIVLAVPPEVQRQYVVRPADTSNFRPDVSVRGPVARLGQLTPQEILAYVEVLASDAAGTTRTIRREPKVILPPGFELARPLDEVEFEMIERPDVGKGARG